MSVYQARRVGVRLLGAQQVGRGWAEPWPTRRGRRRVRRPRITCGEEEARGELSGLADAAVEISMVGMRERRADMAQGTGGPRHEADRIGGRSMGKTADRRSEHGQNHSRSI